MTRFTLARLLTERRDEIIARFVGEVRRKDLPPAAVSHSLLVDHIPALLDEILLELGRERAVRTSFDALDTSTVGRKHGRQRWNIGYELESLIREYGVLRHCIIEEATHANVEMSLAEFDLLAKCLNVGITEAVGAYVRYREGELAFLAEAGEHLSSSLDRTSIITRLTGLVVPRYADWCAAYVDGVKELPVAHVDESKAPLVRELHRRLSLSVGSEGAYHHVLQAGAPVILEDDGDAHFAQIAMNDEERELLRRTGAHSWMILPLRVKDQTSGAMLLARANSRERYSRLDLPVLQELAAKATAALENARLYELSQRARSRVEAATRAKDEFVAMVSHELRTPLNAILGWTRFHRTGALPEAKKDHVFEVVERNANALNTLVADLLDVSRIITGNIRLSLSLVDVSNVVEFALEGIRPMLESKQLELKLNLGAAGTSIRADSERMQQVVWNLLSNAIKFTPKGGSIEVSLKLVNSDLEFSVRDTGVGISTEFLPQVFDSFRQWESGSTRRHGGLGIGLSIAKHLVELHGGTIAASSDGPGTGATFVVRLPVANHHTRHEGTKRAVAARTQAVPVLDGLDGLRVLVVDDDDDARELFRALLHTAGIEVRTAESAERALTSLEEFRPDVVISDVAMPGEDGYSFIRRIRTLSTDAAATPAIALTAYARSADRRRALVEGFNAHISKPVEPADLLTTIAELAGRPPTSRRQ